MKAYYHARAREYDDWWLGDGLYADRDRPGWDEARTELASWIRDLPAAKTLDVACGTGFLTQHLRGEITGFDQSEAMLEVAAEQVPDATFVQGDALDLPFADGEFDRLFTSYFYCHLEAGDRERFLDGARRVARELVVVGSRRRGDERLERWEDRHLKDGTTWQVFKRVFVPADLARELGGRVAHENDWFVLAVAP